MGDRDKEISPSYRTNRYEEEAKSSHHSWENNVIPEKEDIISEGEEILSEIN